jgi:shikimate kinase/3-dehydroquinate synthase
VEGHVLSDGGGPLVLTGFMGAGKSTTARALAGERGGAALDTDAICEERLGHTIAEEFERAGEASFRALEETVVCETLAHAGANDVVALGGGSVLSERVREALEPHLTVLLDVDADTAWERAARRGRPLARDRDAFGRLYAERETLYERVARAFVPASGPLSAVAALPSLDLLRSAPAPVRLLWATSASADYPVLVGPGALSVDVAGLSGCGGRRYLVSDENVVPLHGGTLAHEAEIVLAPGEEHKTLSTAEHVWERLAELGATRSDHLAALGGGVVGDVAGFCAACYQRGISIVQAPTTLVAQVDSAYGGKTGVDLPAAKNYVGAYHQPAAVLADTGVLATLPEKELSAGYAEVLKTALIAGGELWRRVAAGDPVDAEVILGCARLKLAVVAADERDGGRRQVLNLGHTIGHAIETATGYRRFRHGEAVALGLLAALSLSEQPQLRAQVAELLAAQGLPTTLTGVEAPPILAAVQRDKKRTDAGVPFVLVQGPGDVREGNLVEHARVEAAVRELSA